MSTIGYADRKDKRFFDFMCSCNDGQERCDEVYEAVKESLNTTDKKFTNDVVYGLQRMDSGLAEITGIPSDMWAGIAIEYKWGYKGYKPDNCKACDEVDDKDEEPDCEHGWNIQKFWVECDEIHHGLARAYQLVSEFDKTNTGEGGDE